MNLYKTFLKKRITREWKNDTWVCYYAALKSMKDFPNFMKSKSNHISSNEQNTEYIDGYFYEGADGSQMAF